METGERHQLGLAVSPLDGCDHLLSLASGPAAEDPGVPARGRGGLCQLVALVVGAATAAVQLLVVTGGG